MNVIKVSGAHKSFGSGESANKVLNNLNMTVEKGAM
jgi:hypothetical protein